MQSQEWQTGNRCFMAKVVSPPLMCTSALQNSNWAQQRSALRLYLERFLKTICRRFPLSGRQKLHSCPETWLPRPEPLASFCSVSFQRVGITANDLAARRLSSRTSPHLQPLPGSGDTYFNAAYLRPTWDSREHGGTANQRQLRGSDGCARAGEGGPGRAGPGPKRCVSISDPCP